MTPTFDFPGVGVLDCEVGCKAGDVLDREAASVLLVLMPSEVAEVPLGIMADGLMTTGTVGRLVTATQVHQLRESLAAV